MTSFSHAPLDRRALIRKGGLVLSFGAVIAACGDNRAGGTDPGRLGVAAPGPTLPEAEVDDGVLLRTAQSIEYTALAVYEAAADLGVLSSGESALVARFVSDHERHAADLGTLIAGAGAEEYTCPNPFLMDRIVGPVLAAIGDDSDDLHRDVLNIAHAFESLAGASYQALVSALEAKPLRVAAIRIGGEEHRHAAALAAAINPDNPISPVLVGEVIEADDEGFLPPYAIPSSFGRLTAIDLVVGKRNAEGTRFATQLQTPAANTFVYDYESC
jgi:hypothetical protein